MKTKMEFCQQRGRIQKNLLIVQQKTKEMALNRTRDKDFLLQNFEVLFCLDKKKDFLMEEKKGTNFHLLDNQQKFFK